jgi:trk system potassium uptake protein TrkH
VIEYRPVLFFLGILLSGLAAAMIVPALVDASYGSSDWQAFAAAAAVTLFVGIAFMLVARGGWTSIPVRHGFVLTTASWVLSAAFGALPFLLSDLDLSYADAFFEAMSGITTTGSTVLTGLDEAPRGILLWRALLQWLGGVGFIVTAVAILPMLQVGGMQLFRTEFSDPSGKVLPRVGQLATSIGGMYLLATGICMAALWIAGMTPFEAVAHAMTTIATGGFSTSDASIGHFNSAPIEWITVAFMIVGSLPFLLLWGAVRGNAGGLWRDTQVRWFAGIVVMSVFAIALWQWSANGQPLGLAIRESAFNVTSIITGTGYTSADYWQWGTFPAAAFLFFMFVGGCAGSTSCSVKVFRYQILYQALNVQMARLMRPHAVAVPQYNGRPVPGSVTDSVFAFFFLFLLLFALLAFGLSALGLDFVTAVSSAATAIANVGPGLGDVVGPTGTFASLPDAAKWLMAAGMLLGRLEVFTVLVLLSPAFWRA